MERKVWKLDIDGAQHEVVLNWSYWGGFRQLVVDDRIVDTNEKLMRGRSEQRIEVAGHPVAVRTQPIKPLSPYFRIMLELDGRDVAPEPAPKSTWER